MKEFFLVWIAYVFAFDPKATVYRIYSADSFQPVYEYEQAPWVMQNFVDKLNQVCNEKNLGFQYELTQEENPPAWDGPDVSKIVAALNSGQYDAIISNAVGPLISFGVIPYLTQNPSRIPFIMSALGHSDQFLETAPSNMYFPTPVMSNIYDRMLPLFKDLGMKKHVLLMPVSCPLLEMSFPVIEKKKKDFWGEENYQCHMIRKPDNECDSPDGICMLPFNEILDLIGDADIVEFFEYINHMPFVRYIHEQKIDFKALIFISQQPFREEDLDIAMYGLIENRGLSEDSAYHQNYDDGLNHIGIFAASENKTSQQTFNEWFYEQDAQVLKLATIGEIIGWYYLHHNIIRAREANVNDLADWMDQGTYFPSIIGMAGTGMSRKNDDVSKSLWMQVLPEDGKNGPGKRKILYPLEVANVYAYTEIVPYDDRECTPDCPECYDNICEYLTTLVFVALGAGVAAVVVVMIVAFIFFKASERLSIVFQSFIPIYSVVEVIACLTSVTSIHSVRASKDAQNLFLKWILTIFSATDGFVAVLRLIEFLAVNLCGLDLIDTSMFFTIESVNTIFIIIGTVFYFVYISQSVVETKSSAPQIVDITLNLIELILFALSDDIRTAIERNVPTLRTQFSNMTSSAESMADQSANQDAK